MKKLSALFLSILIAFSGCGYTRKVTLPQGIQTIYIDTVRNEIPVHKIYSYEPGMEILITQAVIRRIQKDGNLKIVAREDADAVLETSMTDFMQEGTRFTNLEQVQEFRMFIVLAMRLINNKTKDVIWEEPSFTGDAEYYVTEVKSLGREEASRRAADRLAKNIVDRIVEDW